MSRGDLLIKDLCPNGVPFKTLGSIAEIGTGRSNGNEAEENGIYPFFIRSQTVRSKNSFEFDEEAIIIPGEGGIGEIFHYINGKYALHQRVYRIHFLEPCINVKFIFHYMKAHFKSFILQKAVNATVTSIRKPMIEDFSVPIPPLPIQEEIVRILDAFSELEAELEVELEAELEARKKQYAYYREKLLEHPKNESTWLSLSELGKWTGGKTPSTTNREFWDDGDIPWISSKDMKQPTLSDTQNHLTKKALSDGGMTLLPEGTVALVARSGILQHTLPVAFVPFRTTINQDIKALIVDEKFSARYVFHALRSYAEDIRTYAKKLEGTVDSLDFDKVLAYKIPVPSLEIQHRLTETLDHFEEICSDLNIGLPAEIEARRKQYECYRDALFNYVATNEVTDRQTDRQH